MQIINLDDFKSSQNKYLNLFSSNDWVKVIKKSYFFPVYYYTERATEIPFAVIDNKYEKKISLFPFSDYLLLNCDEKFIIDLFQNLRQKYPEYKIQFEAVFLNKAIQDFTENNSVKKTIAGKLQRIYFQDYDVNAFTSNAYARNIKKSVKNGVTVRISRDREALDVFYQLHSIQRVKKFKKFPQPFYFFENLFLTFIENGKGFFFEAVLNRKVIAIWIIIEHGKSLYYKYGTSDQNELKHRPNDLLFHSLLKYGKEKSHHVLDMGFSGIGEEYEGLVRFKKKERGTTYEIVEYSFIPEGYSYSGKSELAKLTKSLIQTKSLTEIQKTSEWIYPLFA